MSVLILKNEIKNVNLFLTSYLGKFAQRKNNFCHQIALVKYSRHIAEIEAFGKHLRKVRKRQGFTQEELAYASDMELSQVSRIEMRYYQYEY